MIIFQQGGRQMSEGELLAHKLTILAMFFDVELRQHEPFIRKLIAIATRPDVEEKIKSEKTTLGVDMIYGTHAMQALITLMEALKEMQKAPNLQKSEPQESRVTLDDLFGNQNHE